jgi:hypothetical protein
MAVLSRGLKRGRLSISGKLQHHSEPLPVPRIREAIGAPILAEEFDEDIYLDVSLDGLETAENSYCDYFDPPGEVVPTPPQEDPPYEPRYRPEDPQREVTAPVLRLFAEEIMEGGRKYSRAELIEGLRSSRLSEVDSTRFFYFMLEAWVIERGMGPDIFYLGGTDPYAYKRTRIW